jgi:hypothetical protein
MRKIVTEKGEVIYLNSGDWIENLTSLEFDGVEWKIYRYRDDKQAQAIKLPKRLESKLDNDEIFRDLVNEFLTTKK